MFSERKTGDGGTVAIYSDITELKQREKELTEKSKSMETAVKPDRQVPFPANL